MEKETVMRSKFFTKALSLLLVVLTLGYIMSVGAFAADAKSSSQSTTHSLVLTSEATTVAIGRKVQMTAKVTNVDKQPTITWSTSDEDIASVDTNGVVKGKNVGKAVIKASAKVDGKTITGEFEINVIKNKALLQNFLEKHQVLSYQYSYVDDYYYTNDKEAWQKHFDHWNVEGYLVAGTVNFPGVGFDGQRKPSGKEMQVPVVERLAGA